MTEAELNTVETASAPGSLSALKPKMKLTGRVTKVDLFGAQVDVGVGKDGLIHISQLDPKPVNRVEDVLKEGQEITAWVRRVDARSGRLDLTLIQPLQFEWNEIRKGMTVTGKVVRLEKFGAFVDIGAARPGLVHVSELAEGYVREPGQVVSVGDEVEALIVGLDRKKKRIDLSVKAAQQKTGAQALVEETEAVPTAFEVALRLAMAARSPSSKKPTGSRRGSRRQGRRREVEEIFARTLKQHAGRK